MGDVDKGGGAVGNACAEAGVYGKSLRLPLNFAMEPKLLLKSKVLIKKKKKEENKANCHRFGNKLILSASFNDNALRSQQFKNTSNQIY